MESAVGRITRWVVLASLLGMIAAGTRELGAYLELYFSLHGKHRLERGYIGADLTANFLNYAGHPRTRRELLKAHERRNDAPSSLGPLWVWMNVMADTLPADAAIYLEIPGSALYYYATFFWFPRRVAASRRPEVVKDDETLSRTTERTRDERDAIRRLGYTHLVTGSPRGLYVADLRASAAAAPR